MYRTTLIKTIFACVFLSFSCSSFAAQLSISNEDNQVISRSALGAWVLKQDLKQPRMNCAIRFIPLQDSETSFSIFGPTKQSSSATILFQGKNIPTARSPQDARVELVQKKLASTPLKAQILPSQNTGILAVSTGDIHQTLKSMRDAEHDLQLRLNHATIFSLDYDGLALARNAMLDCIAGKTVKTKTLKQATAEIRPLGNSTITGQAFYKGAILAKKQYPPKGSQAVGLIWMTDEFKAWYEQVKRNQKIPEQIPENILKHFMSTRILDDQGHFKFTNLPAGEYILVANFSYEKSVSRTEVVGRTDVYVGNQHIGSNDQIAHWSYVIKEGTSFEKPVTIPKDGDSVNIILDKSQIMCFLVCF
ncbi:hypothetical protein [Acinetobacter haemolyticus]|uniref:Carboxypeptidase regulatory-like domain-containing protein n=1 Tax=Acinetobacter haemolyticus TaxID=29430 RepID=A0A3R9R0B1_ACIHA|nr:hypothetical protein [Acinetobacter haemolyticus]ENW21627.1 hypothetical protein F926_00913 [Acinetobacter haemolyticus NIPH 261]NAR29422.1 hypothetical protein [Acinetobacter haemolyticus]NAR76071.1 hypothetical protein [Acinetobacter haemolyticus]NAR79993.1 hypothetical protein [Acinetobacter haemolyticus]QBQ15312.1 hypothetical protein AHTJR_03010 [Acinetobacter haemolyticus]